MICPRCEKETYVVDSCAVELNVFRTRKCKYCGYKFYTEEIELEPEDARAYMAAVKRAYRKRKANLS